MTLIKRIISSVLVLIPVYLVLYVFPNWVYLALTTVFIGAGMSELFKIVEARGIFVYRYFGIIVGFLIPICIYLHLGENYLDLEPLLIVIACLFAFVLQFIRKEGTHDHVVSIGVTLLALFYISWFFSFMIKLKFLPNGAYLVTFLILVTKIGDVGAYFVGRSIGRHKLIPRISPNKTIEGTIGGIIFSVLMAYFIRGMANFDYIEAVFLGLFLGVLGQVGDLAESLIKRDYGVKDAGKYIPGFGGILDMIDSLLFTTPIFYFYMKMFL